MRCICFLSCLLVFSSWKVSADDRYYTNPVIHPDSFTQIGSAADPFVLKDSDGTYYCYVTGGGYPCFSSVDLVNWRYVRNVFPAAGRKWATGGFWAPEAVKVNSTYYLIYCASTGDGPKRIGIASSTSPTGPFVDLSNKPLIDLGEKGCIDPHILIDDDNRIYCYYSYAMSTNYVPELGKSRSEIFVVELAPDLSETTGDHTLLFYPTQAWEFKSSAGNYWNEGAEVIKHNGTYYLMYSANCYCNSDYAMGYATSSSPTGPFVKYANNPILSNAGVAARVSGPGHHSVTTSPDGTELICVYHSHADLAAKGGYRMVNIDRMRFLPNGALSVVGPSYTAQKYPSGASTSIRLPERQAVRLKIIPNPVQDDVTVVIPEKTEGRISAYNDSGQLMFTAEFPSNTEKFNIPVKSWPAGTYSLRIKTRGAVAGKGRFIKKS
jgi:beta-xylosidase